MNITWKQYLRTSETLVLVFVSIFFIMSMISHIFNLYGDIGEDVVLLFAILFGSLTYYSHRAIKQNYIIRDLRKKVKK